MFAGLCEGETAESGGGDEGAPPFQRAMAKGNQD